MLDDGSKPRLGALLEQALSQWRRAVQRVLAQQGAPWLGAAGDLLTQIPPAGIGQAMLSERVGLSKQAVQQFLDQLERHGLVRRDQDPSDRRAKHVFLTESGVAATVALTVAEASVEREFRSNLGKKRFGRLKRALRRIGEEPGPVS